MLSLWMADRNYPPPTGGFSRRKMKKMRPIGSPLDSLSTLANGGLADSLRDSELLDPKVQEHLKNTQPDRSGIVVDIPLTDISVSPYQPRFVFSEAGLNELSASIQSIGLHNPIHVRASGNGQGYELISGERRLRVFRQLQRETIPCIVKKLGDQDAALLCITDNRARNDLTELEWAFCYRRALDDGWVNSQADLANILGVGKASISRSMSYFKLPDQVLAFLRKNPDCLGVRAVSNFSSLCEDGGTKFVLDALQLIKEGRLSQDAAISWVRRKMNSSKQVEVPVLAPREVMYQGAKIGKIIVKNNQMIFKCSKNGLSPSELADRFVAFLESN